MNYILPAAYCRYCGMFALDEVWEGIERVDGTRSVLSAQDQMAILRGWHALVRSQSTDIFYWMMLAEYDDLLRHGYQKKVLLRDIPCSARMFIL